MVGHAWADARSGTIVIHQGAAKRHYPKDLR
ncbi:hypothetical protein J2Y48_001917 [Mycoplana sp. BE70]|nr:hypothetical protein [Mycoplana sp. BE70]